MLFIRGLPLFLAAINLRAPTATVTESSISTLTNDETNPAAGLKVWSGPARTALVTDFGDTVIETRTRAAVPSRSLRPMGSASAPASVSMPPSPLIECAQKARCDQYVGVAGLDQGGCAAYCALHFRTTLFAHAATGPLRCQCIGACAAMLGDCRFNVYSSAGECPVLPPLQPTGWLERPASDGLLVLQMSASTALSQPVDSDCTRHGLACEPSAALAPAASPPASGRTSSRHGWWGPGVRMSRGQRVLFVCNLFVCLCFIGLAVGWLLATWNRLVSSRELPMLIHSARAALHSPPPLAIVLPVKGAHAVSADNWRAQLTQHGYSGKVSFVFVVQEEADPAQTLIKQLQAEGSLPTEGVQVLVAGLARNTSQKLHNMIYAIERVDETAELVLMLDDDMRMAPGAVDLLAHDLLSDPSLLAASGFSYDVPARWSPVTHAACIFRLLLEVSVSTGGASAAWGGCCMMRRADLLDSVPDGVMQHWKDDGYSDDWIITQVARRHNRRISNPPLLFLNLVEFSTFKQVYNFLHRQFFVLDTYVRPLPGESSLPWVDPHRRESYLLALLQASCGLVFSLGVPLLVVQLCLLCLRLATSDAGRPAAVRYDRPDQLALLLCVGFAAPLCLLSAALLVRMQARIVGTLSPDVGATLASSGRFSLLLAPLGFVLYTAMAPFFVAQGILGSSVVWSGSRYFKRDGRVTRIQRLPSTAAAPRADVPRALLPPAMLPSSSMGRSADSPRSLQPPLVCGESSDDSSEGCGNGVRCPRGRAAAERARDRLSGGGPGRDVSVRCN